MKKRTDRLRRVGHGARSHCSGRFVVFTLALLVARASAGTAQPALASGPLRCSDAATLRYREGVATAGTIVVLRSEGGRSVPVAIPIDSTHGATIRVACAATAVTAGAPDSAVTLGVQSRPGAYREERLRVAPGFSAPPDSALAARMADETRRSAEVSRRSRETAALWRGAFAAPRASRVTSPFGGSRVFNGALVSRHMGLDFAGAVGAPVRAIGRGVVRLVDRFYLGGNVVYLDHGEGLVSAYLHLSRTRVAVGDTVARGSVIGDVGATGRVTGPHLHLIVRLDSVSVDPKSVIGRSLGRP